MIPRPVVAVVEAARRVIHARKALRVAVESKEMNDAGLERLRKALRAAIKALESAVAALELDIERATKAKLARGGGPRVAVPWASIFDAAGKFAGLVAKVQAGDRSAVGDAARFVGEHGPGAGQPLRGPGGRQNEDDVIDGEFTEVR
jgi:hypothetical protein